MPRSVILVSVARSRDAEQCLLRRVCREDDRGNALLHHHFFITKWKRSLSSFDDRLLPAAYSVLKREEETEVVRPEYECENSLPEAEVEEADSEKPPNKPCATERTVLLYLYFFHLLSVADAATRSVDVKDYVFRDFLFFLLSTACTEGLTVLSVRWMQPIQQQGLRTPSLSSLTSLLMCSFRVSSFFTEITQQIHSLRASGVTSSQAARAALSEARAFRISSGSVCTLPLEIAFLVIRKSYITHAELIIQTS